MSKIFAIASQKGGVGKTTSAINLAGAFSLRGKKVLIIDMDPQGGVVFGLGLKKESIMGGVYDIFKEKRNAADIVHLTSINNLDLIPFGSFSLPDQNKIYKNTDGENSYFLSQIQEISKKYDFILIDCPPGSGPLTKTALEIADSLIIPLQCEPLALKTLPQLLKLIKTIKSVNASLKLEGILLTQYERSSPISKEVLQQVVNHFPENTVIEVIIPFDDGFSVSYKIGKPLTLSETPIPGASAYKLLADEIINGEITKN